METYSEALTTALAGHVKLSVRALPGRSDGYPPGVLRLLFFLFTTSAVCVVGRTRHDVVHFGDLVLFPLAWLHRLRHRRCARFITVHGLDLIYGNRTGPGPALYRLFLGWIRRNSDAVHCYIANSRNTADLARQSGLSPAVAIPLGVRCSDLAPARPTPQPRPNLLFVGRLIPRKGAGWFAEHVLPHLPGDIRLKVVGKPWDRIEAANLEQNPRVDLLGYLDDAGLRAERLRALAVVMPNRPSADNADVEGFGIAALEAACDGVPLIASAIEGLRDAVIDGRTGFLLPYDDAAAWTDRILEIADWTPEQRKTYADVAMYAVREQFNWERVAADTLSVYGRYATQAPA